MDRYLTKRNIIIAASIFVLLIAGIVGATIYSSIRNKANDTTTTKTVKPTAADAKSVCTDDMIKKADAALQVQPNDYDALDAVSADVLKVNNYKYDVNCLYILVQQSIAQTNVTDGRIYVDILTGLYGGSVTYSPLFTRPQSPSFLNEIVAGQEADVKEILDGENQGTGSDPYEPVTQ